MEGRVLRPLLCFIAPNSSHRLFQLLLYSFSTPTYLSAAELDAGNLAAVPWPGRYKALVKEHERSDRFATGETQTLNLMQKQKEVQCDPMPTQSKESQANEWSIYDTYAASEQTGEVRLIAPPSLKEKNAPAALDDFYGYLCAFQTSSFVFVFCVTTGRRRRGGPGKRYRLGAARGDVGPCGPWREQYKRPSRKPGDHGELPDVSAFWF
jgi:hypothetical protein